MRARRCARIRLTTTYVAGGRPAKRPVEPLVVFEKFFGTANPFAAVMGTCRNYFIFCFVPPAPPPSQPRGPSLQPHPSRPAEAAATFESQGLGPKPEVGTATIYELELSLEELYTGVRKVVMHKKRNQLMSGEVRASPLPPLYGPVPHTAVQRPDALARSRRLHKP